MTQKKKAPSDFDSFIESYVLDKMQQRGGAALTSEDLSDFIKKCGQKFLESTLKGELDYHLKTLEYIKLWGRRSRASGHSDYYGLGQRSKKSFLRIGTINS